MKTLRTILPVAALIAALSLAFVSCEKQETGTADTVQPEIYIPSNPVASDAGSQFVHVTAGGDWGLKLEFVGNQSGWASLSESSGTGSRTNLKLRWDENPADTSRYVSVTITTRAGTGVATFCQNGKGQAVKPVTGNGQDVSTAGWLELPRTVEGDGREMFTHTMTVGGSEVRNYSFDYSYSDFISIWVAYPLNTSLIGSYYGRSEAWGYDPLLPAKQQQYVGSAYSMSRIYGRGHQIPSADRQGSYERNASTYYGTNMTPQIHDFNGGIWATLEGKVRNIAKAADTLYVVTGCVRGSETMPNNGHQVNIPSAYFKALLYYSKGSGTLGKYSGYSGVGVYMDHDGSLSGPCYNYAMTLEELQKKTGLEFFVNLPDNVRSKILVQDASWAQSYLN